VWFFLIFSILIIASDRILKFIIFKNFAIGSSSPLIKNVLYITPTCNKGIAFGFFKENSMLILIAASALTAILIIYIIVVKKPKSNLILSGLFLILSGAVGNLIDRILYGHVLDFIDFRIWPVFNISDSVITIGASLLIWYLLKAREEKRESR